MHLLYPYLLVPRLLYRPILGAASRLLDVIPIMFSYTGLAAAAQLLASCSAAYWSI